MRRSTILLAQSLFTASAAPLGTILTGLLATDGGLFYGGGFRFFGVQLLGVFVTAAYAAVVIFVVFTIIKKTIGSPLLR